MIPIHEVTRATPVSRLRRNPVSADTNADEIVAIATDSSSSGWTRVRPCRHSLRTATAEPERNTPPRRQHTQRVGRPTRTPMKSSPSPPTRRSSEDKGQAVSTLASDGHSQAGAEHPTATPAGPPADVPAGPPADVPAGPPADVPAGLPADVPAGPPEDVPAGPPRRSLSDGPRSVSRVHAISEPAKSKLCGN